MRQLIPTAALLVGLALSACTTETLTPPPVQGPAVIGDNVEIEAWEYLGPEAVESLPSLSAGVRDVGKDIYQVRLIQKDSGFDLVWGQLPCATQPVVVVHADASIEFWPGEGLGEVCEAMEVFHKLTVKWHTTVPFEQWEFTLHPPPEPDAWER